MATVKPKKELFETVQETVVKEKKPKKAKTSKIKISDKNLSISTCEKPIEIKIKLEDGAELPVCAHDGDIGFDIVAKSFEYDSEKDVYVYHTGVYIEGPENIINFALCRSSNTKTNYYLPNGVGLIDIFTYRGEIILKFKNRDSIETRAVNLMMKEYLSAPWYKKLFFKMQDLEDWKHYLKDTDETYFEAPYEVGDKIGQLVFFKKANVVFKQVETLSNTERGKNGFGSSDKNEFNFK